MKMKFMPKCMQFCLFLLVLSKIYKNTTLERKLTEDEKAAPKGNISDEFFESLKADIEKEAGGHSLKFDPNPKSAHEIEYSFPEKNDAKIEIDKEGGKISIHLNNDYESMEVISENLDYEKHRETIFEDFVKPYLDHLNEIMGHDLKTTFEKMESGIKELRIARTQKSPEGNDQEFLVTSTNIEEEKPDSIKFLIKVDGDGMEDGIQGVLEKQPKQGYRVRLFSKYFQNTFILNVETANYVSNESRQMISKMLQRLDHMLTLNESVSEDSEKQLTDEKITESLNKSFEQYKEKGLEVTGSFPKFSIKNDKVEVTTIAIEEVEVGGMTAFKVDADLVLLKKHMTNKFLINSLYEMVGIVDAFFNSVARYTKLSMDNDNEDEYVAPFENDGLAVEETVEEPPKNVKNKKFVKKHLMKELRKVMLKRKV